jgi:RNA polymerase sigma factor (sigma-70 family)
MATGEKQKNFGPLGAFAGTLLLGGESSGAPYTMSQIEGAMIWRQIRTLALAQCPSQRDDAELLHTFITERDEDAFASLVERHGAMVLAVCRGVLHDLHDAEDVFQAAFLVLARKAHTIRKHDSLASWLHGVSYRLALKAKARIKRQAQLDDAAIETPASSVDDLTFRELRAILHEELNRLPEKYRAPLLLCYWEGKTRDEAAEQLGVTSGAFKKCLERARGILGSRLVGRGLIPSAAIFTAAFFDSSARAAASGALIKSTAHAAVAFASGHGAPGVSVTAVALAQGAIRIMTITKWASTTAAAMLLVAIGAGLTWGGYSAMQQSSGGGAFQLVAVPNDQQPKGGEKAGGKQTDAERILGTWVFVDGFSNGNKMPAEFIAAARMVFAKDGGMSMKILSEEKGGSFKIVEPGKIDLNAFEKKDAKGIYKFDGNDKLSLCFTEVNEAKRPTEFSGDKDSGQVLMVLRRAKPGEENPKNVPGVEKLREAAARSQSANNIKQIGLAFHNYHDSFGMIPQEIFSKDGKKALLSWRIAILPFIEQEALYKEFKLEESWDSDHNKKLIAKMPRIYASVMGKADPGKTHYQVFTGFNTPFEGKKLKMLDITDGTSNTILVVEAKNAIEWTRPGDLKMPKEKEKLPELGGMFSNGFNVAMFDGSVRFLPFTVESAVFRKMVSPRADD